MVYTDYDIAIMRALLSAPATVADFARRCDRRYRMDIISERLPMLIHNGDIIGPDENRTYQLTPKTAIQVHAATSKHIAHLAPIAESIRDDLRNRIPDARVEIAGSVRRQKDFCNDIEICIHLPATNDLTLTNHHSPAHALIADRALMIIKNGPRYMQSIVDTDRGPTKLDMFITNDPDQWGMLYFIRTGCADFVTRALTHWKKITAGGRCENNRLYRAGATVPIETPTEADVFVALGCPFVPPEQRIER